MITCRWFRLALLGLVACAPPLAQAFTVTINPGPPAMYLRVGDGAFANRTYQADDTRPTPGNSSGGIRNIVTLTNPIAPSAVGNGVDQPMISASRVTSDYDNFPFCNAGQTYVGGFFRNTAAGSTATLSANVTAPLSNGTATIPFSQIGWTATGNATGGGFEGGVQPISSNTFGDTAKNLAIFPVNSWRESCHSFYYSNDAVVAAGDYLGTITYTLVTP